MNRLQRAWNNYGKEVEAYAAERFEKVIRPWLDQNNYSFRAAPGWGAAIFDQNNHGLERDELPKFIQKELDREVPGDHINTLEIYMPDYN